MLSSYETEYDYSMPVKDAKELALKALLNATFYNKNCGGIFHGNIFLFLFEP